MTTDRQLLFAVLAFQLEHLDLAQLSAACRGWAADKSRPIADLIVERGWITAEEREQIERLAERKLKRYGGDVHATLGLLAGSDVRDAVRAADDADLRTSLTQMPPAAGHLLVETMLKPVTQVSRYSLTTLHGQGGLGRIWLARDVDLNREVALKEIQPHQSGNSDAARRFLKEAQVTGQLEHPNIVPVYELGRRPQDDQPFYTMRFVRGRTLREAIRDYHAARATGPGDPLALPRLLSAFVAICNALGYAHSRGVIHRDLKPDNVILGAFGEVLVLDWGLAKLIDRPDEETAAISVSESADQGATLAGSRLGTPGYMAPEQADGRIDLIDGRTDVYGLGAILFEILTCEAPHTGATTGDVLQRIVQGDTPRARVRRADVPRALDAICAKAMAKSRNDRYATAGELAEEVQRWLADEPVRVYADPWLPRLTRWARKHRAAALSAGFTLIVIAVVSVIAAAYVADYAQRMVQLAEQREAQRQRADRLFHEGQKLSQWLLADHAHELATLPGASQSQAALAQQMLTYLDALAAESTDDLALAAEVASAYERLAEVQGDPNSINFGHPEQALETYRKAETLRTRLAASAPGNLQAGLDLLTIRATAADVLASLQRSEEARAAYESVRAEMATLRQAHPENGPFPALEIALTGRLGDLLQEEGQLAAAAQKHRDALQRAEKLFGVAPKTPLGRRVLALAHARLGSVLEQTGDLEAARTHYQQALDSAEAGFISGNIHRERTLTVALIAYGDLLTRTGEYAPAAAAYQRAADLRRPLHEADPVNATLQRDLAVVLERQGTLQQLQENTPAALTLFRESLRLTTSLAKDHAANPQFRRDLWIHLDKLGGSLQIAGQLDDAEALFRQQREVARALVAETPQSVTDLQGVAQALDNLGNVAVARPTMESTLDEIITDFKTAIDLYRKSVETFTAIEKIAPLNPSQIRLRDATNAKIEQVKSGLERLEKTR